MVWAAAGNLSEQNKNNKCVNRPPGTAVKKYAGTYDLPCTIYRVRGFSWPRTKEESLEIMPEQYRALMQGLEIISRHPIQEVQPGDLL